MTILTHETLRQFTGTEQWFRHSLMRNVLYTEGVQYLAEKADCYWLIDKVATLQLEPKIKAEEFQVWKLQLKDKSPAAARKDNSAMLFCEDGNGHVIYREHITFTDFPLDEIVLWFTGNCILLPSEY